jgi:hypothetical protein
MVDGGDGDEHKGKGGRVDGMLEVDMGGKVKHSVAVVGLELE